MPYMVTVCVSVCRTVLLLEVVHIRYIDMISLPVDHKKAYCHPYDNNVDCYESSEFDNVIIYHQLFS